MRPATAPLSMTDGQREILERLVKSQTAKHRDVTRAKALLLAEDGMANTAIAWELGVSPSSVTSWRSRFEQEGIAKFGKVKAGRGRKPTIPDDKVAAIVEATLHERPPGETHWSCRSMAKAQGVSPATVQRVWSARGLKPHLVKTLKAVRREADRRGGPLPQPVGPGRRVRTAPRGASLVVAGRTRPTSL